MLRPLGTRASLFFMRVGLSARLCSVTACAIVAMKTPKVLYRDSFMFIA